MGVRIVTDSTADLPAPVREAFGIEMVPLTVHFGPDSYKDGVDIDAAGFWRILRSSPHHPRTAQPSPGDFLEVYRRLAEQGDEILSIHISGQLSGTIASAQVAAGMLPEARITLLDTRSASAGTGLVVLEAARLAREGRSAAEILPRLQEICSRMHVFFTLDTLEFLQRNGRIGKAQALLGSLLGVKPILQVDREGVVAPLEKVRGKARVLPRTLQLMQERVPPGSRVRMAVLYAEAPDEAARWLEAAREIYQVEAPLVCPIGPIIAAHAGPGTIGFAFYAV
ncbi:MAG TPA: DegV family protein [Symbiobacteriaceae bacterium]